MSDTFWLGYLVFRLGLWPTRHSLPWSVSLPPVFAYQSVFPAPKRVFTTTSNEAGEDHLSKCGDIGRGAAVASWQGAVHGADGISEGWNTFLQVQYWQLISKKLFWAFDKFDLFYSLRMYQLVGFLAGSSLLMAPVEFLGAELLSGGVSGGNSVGSQSRAGNLLLLLQIDLLR